MLLLNYVRTRFRPAKCSGNAGSHPRGFYCIHAREEEEEEEEEEGKFIHFSIVYKLRNRANLKNEDIVDI